MDAESSADEDGVKWGKSERGLIYTKLAN